MTECMINNLEKLTNVSFLNVNSNYTLYMAQFFIEN